MPARVFDLAKIRAAFLRKKEPPSEPVDEVFCDEDEANLYVALAREQGLRNPVICIPDQAVVKKDTDSRGRPGAWVEAYVWIRTQKERS